MKKFIQWCLFSVIFLSLFTQTHAAGLQVLSEHDVQALDELRYQLGDTDPYWVFKTLTVEPGSRAIRLPINIIGVVNNDRDIKLELFFKEFDNDTLNSQQPFRFNPLHRLKYLVPASRLNEAESSLSIVLVLPEQINQIPNNSLRLDIENCTNCVVNFNQNTDPNITQLAPSMTINGAQPIPKENISLNPLQWQLNDLERQGDRLNTVGDDPYLVSPPLNIAASSLGGVLIELTLEPNTAPRSTANIQLFYSTEQHSFIEAASTVIKSPSTKDGGTQQNFFIPLDFISSQNPVMSLLKRLRLDVEQLTSVSKITLINKQSAQEYQTLIPSRIYQSKLQYASGRQIIASIFKNLSSDLNFIIFYGLLFVLTAVAFRWAYKR